MTIPTILLSVLFYSLFLANWKEELQKYISPDNIPEYYGGTRCEPDVFCSNYVRMYVHVNMHVFMWPGLQESTIWVQKIAIIFALS